MPRSSRRRESRRRPPPRPTYRGAPVDEATPATTRRAARNTAQAQHIARQTPYLVGELRRVALTSIACFGLLVVLVVVDRLQ